MKKTFALAATCLAVIMVLAPMSGAKALSPPSWVPQTVAGWTLAYSEPYNASYYGVDENISVGGVSLISNWTQMWIQGSLNNITGLIGVVSLEYSSDFLDAPISSENLQFIHAIWPGFTGSTPWQFMKYVLVTNSTDTDWSDVTSQVSGATGALAFNSSDFYMLYAYSGAKVMMLFSFDWSEYGWDSAFLGNESSQIAIWFGFAIEIVVLLFFVFADYLTESSVQATPASTINAQNIHPESIASLSVLESFAGTYVSEAAPKSTSVIPGYSILLVSASLMAGMMVLVEIARKRKLAVV